MEVGELSHLIGNETVCCEQETDKRDIPRQGFTCLTIIGILLFYYDYNLIK